MHEPQLLTKITEGHHDLAMNAVVEALPQSVHEGGAGSWFLVRDSGFCVRRQERGPSATDMLYSTGPETDLTHDEDSEMVHSTAVHLWDGGECLLLAHFCYNLMRDLTLHH